MKLLEQGNATMGVWLGKQLLGQRDMAQTEVTGKDGGPIMTIAAFRELVKIAEG